MEQVTYKFASLAELALLIDFTKPVMFDTETIGFYGKIRLAQFYQRHFECPILVEYPNPYELVSLLTKAIVICHNVHYDITTIQENLGRLAWAPEQFHCTFLLARLHFYKKEKFSLDAVIGYVLGEHPYGITKKDMQLSDWSTPVLSEEQKSYAALDVYCLHEVWDVVRDKLDDINYKLDLLTTEYCLDFQNNGMPVDMEKLQARYAKNMARLNEIALPINCNSYVQVRKYINSMSSDDHGLSLLSIQGNERAKAVRETRKLTKNNSFLTKFINTAIDGIIYGKFKCSPRSGRTASDDQNLQQIPRTLKEIFGIAQDGDEVIVFSDFAQIQLRGVCVVTGDTAMETLFRAGKDLHSYVAEMIFGAAYTKVQRQIAKTANFGLLFGAGIIMFIAILVKQADLLLPEAEARNIRAKWLTLWRQVKEWQDKGIKAWKKGEAWETPLGRRYTSKLMTDQLAMQIQGFEAEIAKLAMHYMMPKMRAYNESLPAGKPKIRLRNFMHDSYLFTCWKDETTYKLVSETIASCMQEAWKEMCQSVKITDLPMPVKVRVGYNWGDIENDEYIYELTV